MYICETCHAVFDEPGTEKEKHDELDGSPCELFYVCPVCGGTGYEEAAQCEMCGEWKFGDELTEGHYCDDCLKEAITFDSFREFARQLDGRNYMKLEYSDGVSLMEMFVMNVVFGWNYYETKRITSSSADSKYWFDTVYDRWAERGKRDKYLRRLDQIKYYIFDDEYTLKEAWAEWLYQRDAGPAAKGA